MLCNTVKAGTQSARYLPEDGSPAQSYSKSRQHQRMNNPQKKQRIRVTRASRGYELGKIYTIVRVDPNDSTLVAADSNGTEGSWVKWELCVLAGPEISWDWLKGQLPGEVLELLSAFQGLENLRLKPEVRDHILLQLPNLKERILSSQVAIEEEFGTTDFSSQEAPPAAEEDEELCA